MPRCASAPRARRWRRWVRLMSPASTCFERTAVRGARSKPRGGAHQGGDRFAHVGATRNPPVRGRRAAAGTHPYRHGVWAGRETAGYPPCPHCTAHVRSPVRDVRAARRDGACACVPPAVRPHRGRGRRPGRVPDPVAAARLLRPGPRHRPSVALDGRPQPQPRSSAAARGPPAGGRLRPCRPTARPPHTRRPGAGRRRRAQRAPVAARRHAAAVPGRRDLVGAPL